jgi:hypothetical protein
MVKSLAATVFRRLSPPEEFLQQPFWIANFRLFVYLKLTIFEPCQFFALEDSHDLFSKWL